MHRNGDVFPARRARTHLHSYVISFYFRKWRETERERRSKVCTRYKYIQHCATERALIACIEIQLVIIPGTTHSCMCSVLPARNLRHFAEFTAAVHAYYVLVFSAGSISIIYMWSAHAREFQADITHAPQKRARAHALFNGPITFIRRAQTTHVFVSRARNFPFDSARSRPAALRCSPRKWPRECTRHTVHLWHPI